MWLPDMTSKTRIQLEQCQGLIHVLFLIISPPRFHCSSLNCRTSLQGCSCCLARLLLLHASMLLQSCRCSSLRYYFYAPDAAAILCSCSRAVLVYATTSMLLTLLLCSTPLLFSSRCC